MSILERLAVFTVQHLDLDKESHVKIFLFIIKHFLNGNELFSDKLGRYSAWLYSTKGTKFCGGAVIFSKNAIVTQEERDMIYEKFTNETDECFGRLRF